MNRERHQQANAIFLAACDLEAAAIPAFVRERCGEDAALAQQVYALLAADAHEDGFLEAPQQPAPALGVDSVIGERRYRLRKRLGVGGMGEVWLAERADGEFRQRVAIKLIQANQRLSREALRRFRAERQILAAFNHPHIARLLDGGTLADGAPFLVMEYVEGEAIDVWCEQAGLSARARVSLFLKVCDAVQAAHAALIVHRDLKPSNILVGADGEPRLLDFGIAKVLNAELFTHSLAHTRTGVAPMTLAYASPEQVRGEVVGTASDVYALGVVLYELLTGTLPYRVAPGDPVSMARAVCEEAPEAPSRSTQRADAVAAGPSQRPELRGDLDAILLKALRKEAAERYRSVEHFAADLQRWLDGQPVLARRGSRWYTLRKFAARRRYALLAAGAFVALLCTAVVLLRLQLAQTERERDRAQAVTRLLTGMFAAGDPLEGRAGSARADVTVREAISATLPSIERDLASQPELQASLRASIGRLYLSLGLERAADQQLGLALTHMDTGPATRERIETRLYLMQVQTQAHPQRALGQFAPLLADLRALGEETGFDAARAHRGHGSALRMLGRLPEAQAEYELALTMLEALRGHAPGQEAAIVGHIGGVTRDLAYLAQAHSDYPRCAELAASAAAQWRGLQGADSLLVASALATEGDCRREHGDLEVAEQRLREALGLYEASAERDSLAAARLRNLLAILLAATNRPEEAAELYRRAEAVLARDVDPANPELLQVQGNRAILLADAGKLQEAISIQRGIVERLRARNDASDDLLIALNNLAHYEQRSGAPEEAGPHFRQALALASDPRSANRALVLNGLGKLDCEGGRHESGIAYLREAADIRAQVLDARSWASASTRNLLGDCLARAGRLDEARPLLRESLQALKDALGAEHPRVHQARERSERWLRGQ